MVNINITSKRERLEFTSQSLSIKNLASKFKHLLKGDNYHYKY